jgi:hypothetical protein
MATKPRYLSEKSIKVLRLIADGHSYGQIVGGNSDIKYPDIFDAAEEALRLNDTPSAHEERLEFIKKKYSRAYERWTQNEDANLVALHADGLAVDELAARFQRQPSAIRSRLDKLAPKEPA